MRLFLVLLIFLVYSLDCVLTDKSIDKEWEAFKKRFGKHYSKKIARGGRSEDDLRKKLFESTVSLCKHHNERYKKGLETFILEVNKFADLTSREKKILFGLVLPKVKPVAAIEIKTRATLGISARKKIPSSVDWSKKGFITPVKNQGPCRSCWAFSSVAAVEAHIKIAKGSKHRISGSEQQLVDCDKGNNGCDGGFMTVAFEYMKKHGLMSSAKYPYKTKRGTCAYKPSGSIAKIQGFAEMTDCGNEKLMAEIVANKGPVSVAITSDDKFVVYKKGVYYSPKCNENSPNHAVLVVGYGSEKGQEYWLVKNSFGTDWGDKGFIKMARNRKNNCYIASLVSYPLL